MIRSSADTGIEPGTGKLDACVLQAETAVLLLLLREHPAPIHTLISASRGILEGIHKHRPIGVFSRLDAALERRLVAGCEKEWRRYEKRVANFLKHADRDPQEFLPEVDLCRLNSVELLVVILALADVLGGIPETLWAGCVFLSRDNQGWFDFDGLVLEHEQGERTLEILSNMSEEELRQTALKIFRVGRQKKGCVSTGDWVGYGEL